MDTGQRRAKAGGEYGPNGEFYQGGSWIATTDRPKMAPHRSEPLSDEERARRQVARDAEWARAQAFQRAHDEWRAARVARFGDLLAVLESEPLGIFRTFHQSLAEQLRARGCLSQKQARYAVRALLGRENKRNHEQWDTLMTALPQEFVYDGPSGMGPGGGEQKNGA